jgi:hypothetical protein
MERQCQWCGAYLSTHGGHGGPIRRHGWVSYECGTRWHPQHGWSRDLVGGCEARAYKSALEAIRYSQPLGNTRARRIAADALSGDPQ